LQYPKLLGAEVKVHVIQSRDHILNTYSEKISEYAESKFARNDVTLWTNARVAEVQPDKVIITLKDSKNKDEKPRTEEIPAGFVLWSTGIGTCLSFARRSDAARCAARSSAGFTYGLSHMDHGPRRIC
jgi:NADH dehydrogenase FAD-containing subunit